MRIGVVSDSHGLLRPEVLKKLAQSDLIIHAGDLGSPEVIDGLSEIAPVAAIRGNIDKGEWAEQYPPTRLVTVQSKRLYVLHNIADLLQDPVAEQWDAVIFGHSHKPGIAYRNQVLYLNPGSIGPRRFKLPVALAELRIVGDELTAEIHEVVL